MRAVAPLPLERDIQSAVVDLLARHPRVANVFRVNSGAHVIPGGNGHARRFIRYHTIPGMSDLWVWLTGTPVQAFIEVKRPGERATEAQLHFLEHAREHGHIALVVTDPKEAWDGITRALPRPSYP